MQITVITPEILIKEIRDNFQILGERKIYINPKL